MLINRYVQGSVSHLHQYMYPDVGYAIYVPLYTCDMALLYTFIHIFTKAYIHVHVSFFALAVFWLEMVPITGRTHLLRQLENITNSYTVMLKHAAFGTRYICIK